MEVHSAALEQYTAQFRRDFRAYGIEELQVGYYIIDTAQRQILHMNSSYDWTLSTFGEDKDVYLHRRFLPGLQSVTLDDIKYAGVIQPNMQQAGLTTKIDLCIKHGPVYELFSIGSKTRLHLTDFRRYYALRNTLMNYATHYLLPRQELYLPMRCRTHATETALPAQERGKMQFDTLTLTARELQLIEYLLRWMRLQEMATQLQCSEDAINRSIDHLKTKFGCPQQPLSALYQRIQQYGIDSGLFAT